MKLLMISGDRSVLQGKKGAFWYTLEELHKHFERIDILTPWAPSTGSVCPYENVQFYPSPRGLWYQPFWIAKKGKELAAEHHHNVMTIHDYPPFYNDFGGLHVSKATGIPAVLEIHHVVGHPHSSDITESIGYMLSRLLLAAFSKRSAAVRCVSGGVAALVRSWGVQRVSVVPSMYLDHDLLMPDPSIRKQYDLVCCARLAPNKGIDRLLEAVTYMEGRSLLIVGDGPERKTLEALARKYNIQDRVTFSGWMATNTDVYRALQSAKVVVMASFSEGGPRIALESMALGVPLIATNVGLMPEVIRDGQNGMITTGTPADIAARAALLLGNDELRTRIGLEAQKTRDRFERTRVIQAYADFLKSNAKQ